MKKDDLLSAVAAVAREKEAKARDDEAWERYARGGEAPQPPARSSSPSPSDDASDAYATHMRVALAPSNQADDARFVQASLRALGAAAPVPLADGPPDPANALAAKSLGGRPRALRRVAFVAVPALAAAAALALFVRTASFTHTAGRLPDYDIEVDGFDADERAVPPAPEPSLRRSISPGARVRWVARPVEDHDTPMAARVLARCEGAPYRELTGLASVSKSGSVRVEARVESLFGDGQGECELVVVFGAEGATARAALAVMAGTPPAQAEKGDADVARVERTRFRVGPRATAP